MLSELSDKVARRLAEKEREVIIRHDRNRCVKFNICPDCGEDLEIRFPPEGAVGVSNFRACPKHGKFEPEI